jgi:hypothetical protein
MLSKGLDLAGEAQSPQVSNVHYISGQLYHAEGADDMARSEYEKAFAALKKSNDLYSTFSVDVLYMLAFSYKSPWRNRQGRGAYE